jgi:hypothetical protein
MQSYVTCYDLPIKLSVFIQFLSSSFNSCRLNPFDLKKPAPSCLKCRVGIALIFD